MEQERETPRPLEAEEIKLGIAQMIADAVYERLGKTCSLFGRSYPKFRGRWHLDLELDDFGQTTKDHSEGVVDGGEIGPGSVGVEVDVDIKEMPPNAFRMETDQPIVKTVVEDGRTVEKRVKYQARQKKGK